MTYKDLRPLPPTLYSGDSEVRKPQMLDRHGALLSISYQNRWSASFAPLHEIPLLLQQAFIQSEDRRFYNHGGADWEARLHALWQNLTAMRAVRGASTITEQVVRMLHPRPRTVWSRWLEGIEAALLEGRFSKNEILEFYINQVPYASQRRGALQAARFYFDRDLDTLNAKEMLALAVLVRAPSGLDLRKNPRGIEKRIAALAKHMVASELLDTDQYLRAVSSGFEFGRSRGTIEASHFVQHLFKHGGNDVLTSRAKITTTLDGTLQEKTRQILRSRLDALDTSDVGDGAALVIDNKTGEVLAWTSDRPAEGESGGWVDAVTVPRQPGSTLKPFLYALAMELGWTSATIIEDSPLTEPVNSGLHTFQNYSRTYYGPIRLRDALGNSLNTPAIRTVQFTGTEKFLERLHLLGITSLNKPSGHYGNGLALGDGEVNLFELVQAYSVFPRSGEFRPLQLLSDVHVLPGESRSVIDPKIASIIGDILSDPQARRLEFGEGHLLRFPVQTAVKTGTSTDHRDCWAVGFTDRHTAGVWMGNLDRRPTNGLSGAIGPALVLRSIFAELNRKSEPGTLPVADGLEPVSICAKTGLLAGEQCPRMVEIFEPGKTPVEICPGHRTKSEEQPWSKGAPLRSGGGIKLTQPTPGLHLALDPRIPADLQAFAFRIPKGTDPSKVEWILNGEPAGRTGKGVHQFLWQLSRGTHLVFARVWLKDDSDPVETPGVPFTVK
ncbi:MAG: transglycosylase domain-containing protein [Syntrophobacteraceae bacterium]